MPVGSIWIEGEDFNHSSGQFVAAADNIATYTGGAYSLLVGVHDTDYHATSGGPWNDNGTPDDTSDDYPDSPNYRSSWDGTAGTSQGIPTGTRDARGDADQRYVPMDAQTTASDLDTQRPGGGTIWTVTTNHKIGWANDGDWYNYTRTIPAGVYSGAGAFSSDNTANLIGGELYLVDNPSVPDAQQVKTLLGVFAGNGATGWGNNILAPLRTSYDVAAPLAYFKLPASPTQKTLRVDVNSGDYDWFAIYPAEGVPAQIRLVGPNTENTPDHWQVRRDQCGFTVELEDFSGTVEPGDVTVMFDGGDVTTAASITKDAATGITTVTYDPGLQERDTYHTFSVSATDSGGTELSVSRRLWANLYPSDDIFVIEAEDFNTGGGNNVAAANTMPYITPAYTDLSAVHLVDYETNDGQDAQDYRGSVADGDNTVLVPNRNTERQEGPRFTLDRGIWTMTANFKLGWVDTGDWQNYTRTFPAKQYEIYLAGSRDLADADPDTMRASLGLVADPTVENQAVTPLGVFRAPGSGAWSRNSLFPLIDETTREKQLVNLSGEQTLRLTGDACDHDYLVLLPVGDIVPELEVGVGVDPASGELTLTWEGTGVAQEATSVAGPYTDNAAIQSGVPFTPAGSEVYYRIMEN
jgi:hypothetical protein